MKSSDVAIATLDVYYRFSSWSVGMRLFDLILEAFGSVARIQYFFKKLFFIFFVVRNYLVGPAVVFRIDSVLIGEQRVVLVDYRCIEDREYTVFGRQFDSDCSEVNFGDRIEIDL